MVMGCAPSAEGWDQQYRSSSLPCLYRSQNPRLTRNTSNSNGAWVDVDLSHTGTQTTTCTAYSFNYTGSTMASETQSWTGRGFHEFQFNLVGANKSNPWSDYGVLCQIPGNSNGSIYGVDPDEQP